MQVTLNPKIGIHKNVSRIWLEGEQLLKAGVRIGTVYGVTSDIGRKRILLEEASPDFVGQTFTVSRRDKNGVLSPVMDLRTGAIKELFDGSERVRVDIREGRIVISMNHVDAMVKERLLRAKTKLVNGSALSVASLFHGGGVMDKAFHAGLARSGISSYVKYAVEMDPTYINSSLRNNRELWRNDSLVACSDIRDLDFRSRRLQADLVVAGIPCASASKAGRSKKKLSASEQDSDYGALFFDFLSAVKSLNPVAALIENVPEYASTTAMMVIRSVLSSLGYVLKESILDGARFGTLERRKRLFVWAYTPGFCDSFDFEKLPQVKVREESIGAVLEYVPNDSSRWKTFDYLAEKEKRDIEAGKGFRRQLVDEKADGCGTVGKYYSKCRSTEIFIVNNDDSRFSRLLTPREHAGVKGIPPDTVAGECDTTAHEILGQSVAFPVVVSLGQAIGHAARISYDCEADMMTFSGVEPLDKWIANDDEVCCASTIEDGGIDVDTDTPRLKIAQSQWTQVDMNYLFE